MSIGDDPGAVALSRVRWLGSTTAQPKPGATHHRSPLLRARVDRFVRPAPPPSGLRSSWPEVPEVVERYLHFMGTEPADRGCDLRVRFAGSFFKPGLGWMPATAWQFDSAVPIERRFVMRIRFGRVLPMVAVDTYRDRRGELRGTLLKKEVAHAVGPELDLGELVTWLNDAVLLAPAQLFDAGVDLVELDDRHFRATVTDGDVRATAVVEVDDDGAPVLFTTTDRFADLPSGPLRAEWRTPVRAWGRTADRRAVPVAASGVWSLPDGPLTYVRGGFDPATFELRPPTPR
jgi:hypothetical protein